MNERRREMGEGKLEDIPRETGKKSDRTLAKKKKNRAKKKRKRKRNRRGIRKYADQYFDEGMV